MVGRIINKSGGEFSCGYWQGFQWMPHPDLATYVRRYNEFGKLIKQPDELGGIETQCSYVIVKDADAHCARAVAAGAKIVKDAGYAGDPWSE